jgi:hypothetical protein
MTAQVWKGLTTGVILCALACPVLAEDALTIPPLADTPKAQTKKPVPPKKKTPAAPSTSLNSTEDAEAAARLAEGRKKFFERSQGFTDGTPASSETPNPMGMGFKF